MQLPEKEILPLNIRELLGGTDNYVIPVYQRNYAWEAKEIDQLIQDIIDYARLHKEKNYYIGTLVVSHNQQEDSVQYDTIDGQQRLTTLSILSAVLKNEFSELVDMAWFKQLNLRFASREKSTQSLNAAFLGNFEIDKCDENIKSAYKICRETLHTRINSEVEYEKISITEFSNYLYKYVQILRVTLPYGLDMNHYFEIMNSRGEQLEKHEILKAELMDCFNVYKPEEREKLEAGFHLIWEACSNMEKYVQYGFTVTQRHIIFGNNDWNNLSIYSFDDFVEKINHTIYNENVEKVLEIDDIINRNIQHEKKAESEESPDRFNAVINFPNFLLHVLRVQTAEDEVALDDKRLIDIFKSQLPKEQENRIQFVKDFIYNLLRCKVLFDKYIIKREFTSNTDRWSLMSLKWYSSGKTKNGVKYVNTFGFDEGEVFDSDNRRVLMLLSMFHTSIPSMSYKYWLNAALNYLFHEFEINSKEYISYLEHIAKSFVFDNYLAIEPTSYFVMIDEADKVINRSVDQLDLNKLRYGNLNNNLVFNFLDYLLWVKYKDIENDSRVKSFAYKFRSSVEHFYPQQPIGGRILADQELHSFGNLCLISHSDNSKYSNYLPDAKSTHYNNKEDLDSIKQFLMIKQCMLTRNWLAPEINKHNQVMVDLLIENLSSDYKPKSNVSLAQRWFKEYQDKDRNLLIRVLLCFGDCTKYINGDKYNLFHFDYIRHNEAFEKFEKYVEKNSPSSLLDIIQSHLTNEDLRNEYRYLFVKYPEVVNFCKEGNFQWFEDADGKLIYLLEGEKRTKGSRELFTFLFEEHFNNFLNTELISNSEMFCINIEYDKGEYFVTDSEEPHLQLQFWNNKGIEIKYSLNPNVNGNSSSIKQLEEYNWQKVEGGVFIRNGRDILIKFQGNFDEIVQRGIEEIKKILKNGLKIKFQ